MSHSSKAIVLNKEKFGEADLFVQFLTKEWGIITVLAKAARKSQRRYVGGLDLFCHDEIFLRGSPKENAYLNELTVLNSFFYIRNNLDKLAVAGKVIAWTRKLGETAHPTANLYSLVGQTLALIEREKDPERLELFSLIFRLKLLSEIGLKPKTDSCINCDEPQSSRWQFDVAAGGILCENCWNRLHPSQHFAVNEEERGFLNQYEELKFTEVPTFQLPNLTTMNLQRLTHQFATYHSHLSLMI